MTIVDQRCRAPHANLGSPEDKSGSLWDKKAGKKKGPKLERFIEPRGYPYNDIGRIASHLLITASGRQSDAMLV